MMRLIASACVCVCVLVKAEPCPGDAVAGKTCTDIAKDECDTTTTLYSGGGVGFKCKWIDPNCLSGELCDAASGGGPAGFDEKTEDDNYVYYTWTQPTQTFQTAAIPSARLVVVGGGGGGGTMKAGCLPGGGHYHGGGGGGGGVIIKDLAIEAGSYEISVGAGGLGGCRSETVAATAFDKTCTGGDAGKNGGNSDAFGITAFGGGGGGQYGKKGAVGANSGGSGKDTSSYETSVKGQGTGDTNGYHTTSGNGQGGGGAGGDASNGGYGGRSANGGVGAGGKGKQIDGFTAFGEQGWFAGGGAGAHQTNSMSHCGSIGGMGGGAMSWSVQDCLPDTLPKSVSDGAKTFSYKPADVVDAMANTGGGGGGTGKCLAAGNGASGVIILRVAK